MTVLRSGCTQKKVCKPFDWKHKEWKEPYSLTKQPNLLRKGAYYGNNFWWLFTQACSSAYTVFEDGSRIPSLIKPNLVSNRDQILHLTEPRATDDDLQRTPARISKRNWLCSYVVYIYKYMCVYIFIGREWRWMDPAPEMDLSLLHCSFVFVPRLPVFRFYFPIWTTCLFISNGNRNSQWNT